jgi:hypothetical protein
MVCLAATAFDPEPGDTDDPFPLDLCFVGEWPMGARMDFTLTADASLLAAEAGAPAMGECSFRLQVLGLPYEVGGMADRAGFPLDCSLEVGGGISGDPFREIFFANAFAGVNVSKPLGSVTPYFSYRDYRLYYDLAREDDDGFVNHEVFVLGAEFTLGEKNPFAVEVYCGQPPGGALAEDETNWRTVGLNVTFRQSLE